MEALTRSISTRFSSNRDGAPTLSTRRRPAAANWKVRKTVLHHRLKELLVFEIHRNGDREYRNMVSETYNTRHVVLWRASLITLYVPAFLFHERLCATSTTMYWALLRQNRRI